MNAVVQYLVVMALLLGLAYFADATNTARAERDDFAAQLKAEKLRTQRLQRDVLAATAKANAARQSLKEALDANPVYRDAAVPVPVRDILCGTLRCKPARTLPTL